MLVIQTNPVAVARMVALPRLSTSTAARGRLPSAPCNGVLPWSPPAAASAPRAIMSFDELSADEPERVDSMPSLRSCGDLDYRRPYPSASA